MRKRVFAFLLSLCLLVSLLPQGIIPARAEDTVVPYAVEDGNIYFDKATGTITNCDKTVTFADIPAEIDGTTVTQVGRNAFVDCKQLKTVVFPETVESAGEFVNCTALNAICFKSENPEVRVVVERTGHNGNTEYVTQKNVIIFASEKYYWPSIVDYPVLKWDGEHIPSFDLAVHEIVVSEEPGGAGRVYFDKATGTVMAMYGWLEEVLIPDQIEGVPVTKIGADAFHGNGTADSVTVPDSVTEIGDHAFEDCLISTCVLPKGLKRISNGLFKGCVELYAVNIPESVEEIGDEAFYVCGELGKVALPKGLVSIGEGAFTHCRSMETVALPAGLVSIGARAFYSTGLTGVTIPASVASIGVGAFVENDAMTTLQVEPGNQNYFVQDNVLFTKDGTTILACTLNHSGSYIIPEGVTTIEDQAFATCTQLTAITFPESLRTIGYQAFARCEKLTSLDLSRNVATIGEEAFLFCNSLVSAFIRSEDVEIGAAAFVGCGKMKSLCFAGNAPTLWQYGGIGANELVTTIYYVEGKAGWTTPEWNGYKAATWDGIGLPLEFSDVKKSAWYYDAVMFAASNGIFKGTSATTFAPNNPMNRAMLVTTLHRLAGEPAPKVAAAFSDVEDGRYFTKPIFWAAENGIVNGMGNNKFQPNTNVTREQAATILHRYAAFSGLDTTARADLSKFPDAGKVSSFAQDSLSWANAEGLINGKKNTQTGVVSLSPKGSATRAELAKILMNFMQKVAK